MPESKPHSYEGHQAASAACLDSNLQLPGAAQGQAGGAVGVALLQTDHAPRRSPSSSNSSWGIDSARAKLRKISPGSKLSDSLGTMESLDSAGALQPPALTFAQLLQQEAKRSAQNTLPGAGVSLSQMTYALRALPELTDKERIARFMDAIHEARPGKQYARTCEPGSSASSDLRSKTAMPEVPEQQAANELHQGVYVGDTLSSCASSSSASTAGESMVQYFVTSAGGKQCKCR